MSRIPPAERQGLSEEGKKLWDEQVQSHGRMTNMKRTLAHSPLALRVLMEWYPLRDRLASFLGDRTTTIFAHALSVQTSCLICSTFFRRLLREAGENPDELTLDSREQVLVQYAKQLTTDANGVKNDDFVTLGSFFTSQEIIEITVFAGMMIATNLFNNALKVDLDDYLEPYRAFTGRSSQ